LRVLDVSNNKLFQNYRKENTEYLCHVIKTNTRLVHLDLSHNRIPESAFKPFQKALKSNNTLMGLHVEGNFRGAEVDPIGFLIKKPDSISR
jgi:hypothetical protein